MSADEPAPDDETTPLPLDDSPAGAQALRDVTPSAALAEVPAEPFEIPNEAPPVAESWHAVEAAVGALGDRLERRLADLQAAFEREVRAEATREKVVDRLHAELQEYKHDFLLKTLRPVFIDLIQLHDDIGKVAAAPPAWAGEGADLVALLDGFRQGIEDVLYRQGVEPYRVEGEAFDPKRQRAVATVPADDPARNKTVAARHRPGFQAGDRVIRPEVVSVYAVKTGALGTP